MVDDSLPRGWRGFGAGIGLWWSGLRAWSRSGRLVGWGLVPGAISVVVFATGLTLLLGNLETLSDSIASRIVGEASGLEGFVSFVAALAIIGACALVVIYTFTAVTLFIGQPAFERISQEIEHRAGGLAAAEEEPWWVATARGAGEGARLLVLSALLALTAFGLGFIPVLGTAVAFTFGALTGGWLLTLELTSYPFARRGLVRLHQRRRYLRAHRSVALGFGAATFVTFLVPLGAVVTMPAAVAGATMLARRIDATDGITVPARPSLEAEPPSP